MMCETKLPAKKLDGLIAYAKIKGSPSLTVLEGVHNAEVDEIITIARRLCLTLCKVDGGKKSCNQITIIGDRVVAIHIAKKMRKRCQVMYNDFARRPKEGITIAALTGYVSKWKIIRDNSFVVSAYDANGDEIPAFLPTDTAASPEEMPCAKMPGGYRLKLLRFSKRYFIRDGVFNETRQCYYPAGNSQQEISDRNKMEKIFRKLM